MKFFRQLIFLLCLPGIFLNIPIHAEVYQNNTSVEDYSHFSPWDLLNYETLSFSRIINFVYAIEYSQSLDGLFSEEQMQQVRDFVVFLARNGIRDDDIEGKQRLEEDITKLFSDNDDDDEDPPPWWYFTNFNGYQGFKIKPAILGNDTPQIHSCGWISKTFKKTKHFVKKHKKAVIISAAVVVAATVIIVATGGAAAPVVGAVGAAAAGGMDHSRPRVNKPGDVAFEEAHNNAPTEEVVRPDICQQPYRPQIEQTPKLTIPIQEIVAQQSSAIKEELSDQIPEEAFNIPPKDEPSFWANASDKARELGSTVAHTIIDGAANTLESAGRLGWALQDDYQDPRGSFDETFQRDVLPLADQLHQKIDLDGVDIAVVPDTNTSLLLYEKGEVDWVGDPFFRVSYDISYKILDKEKDGVQVYWIFMNLDKFPLHNKKFRQALSYSLDREEILYNIFGGAGESIRTVLPPFLKVQVRDVFDDDPALAKKLLNEALEELNMKLEELPALEFRCVGPMEFHGRIAQAIQDQWRKDLGIKMSITQADWTTHFAAVSNGDYELGLMGWFTNIPDPISILENFMHKKDPNNKCNWEHPDFKECIDRAHLAVGQLERVRHVQKAEEILTEEMPVIPLMATKQRYAHNPKLKDVIFTPFRYIDFKYAYFED